MNSYRQKLPKISIIIPVYNEQDNVPVLLNYLTDKTSGTNSEIIVVDGNSSDNTVERVQALKIRCLISKKKGRAAQMKYGAENSNGEILYFVHADSIPPESFITDIYQSLDMGFDAGCYRFQFNSDRPLLKINSYFTRFDRLMCRGGDQTLFVKRDLFEKLGGYKEHFVIMEDFDLIQQLRKSYSFRIMPKNVLVSARKYENNPYLKVNFVNFVIFMMYFFGASQDTMVHAYKQLIQKTRFG